MDYAIGAAATEAQRREKSNGPADQELRNDGKIWALLAKLPTPPRAFCRWLVRLPIKLIVAGMPEESRPSCIPRLPKQRTRASETKLQRHAFLRLRALARTPTGAFFFNFV